MSQYLIYPQVRRVMAEAGISESTLEHMAEHAAICTHEHGNRRWHNWLFRVSGHSILHLQLLSLTEVGTGKTPMIEECDVCEGTGCKACGWAGEIKRWI